MKQLQNLHIIALIALLFIGGVGEVLAQTSGPKIRGHVYGGGQNAKVAATYTYEEYKALPGNESVTEEQFNELAVSAKIKPLATSTTVTLNNGEVYGDIYGGGALADVMGNTTVNIADVKNTKGEIIKSGKFAGDVFGGGMGKVSDTDGKYDVLPANVAGNTRVNITGGAIIWDKAWVNGAEVVWQNGNLRGGDYSHNIYAGGNIACTIGSWKADGSALADGKENTGNAVVRMMRGLIGNDLIMDTPEWKEAFTNEVVPHFAVFGGGYGIFTKSAKSDVFVALPDASVQGNVDGDQQMARPMYASGRSSVETDELPIINRHFGMAWATVHSIFGGGYNGYVGSTNVTVDDSTYVHRIYGGGLGSYEGFVQAGKPATEKGYCGIVNGNTNVTVYGGHVYGDVFGAGAGVESQKVDGTLTDFPGIARVNGSTHVLIADTAAVYGSVYGGGDVANVTNSTSVTLQGGNVFGYVVGAGLGRLKRQAQDYTAIGRVGNASGTAASVLIEDGVRKQFAKGGDGLPLEYTEGPNKGMVAYTAQTLNPKDPNFVAKTEPRAWQDIFGGGRNGITDGNTTVTINGGWIGDNVFGGGLGDVSKTDDGSEVVTAANVNGSTSVTINGGSYLWRQIADQNGNIKNFPKSIPVGYTGELDGYDAPFDRIIINNKAMLTPMFEPITDFFDYSASKYTRDHSIYGGGNVACTVSDSATVAMNHGLFSDTDIEFIDADQWNLATLCRYLVTENSSNYQFGVFGGGYGAHTSVASTNVQLHMGKSTEDQAKWNAFVGQAQENYNRLTQAVKDELYGGTVGTNGFSRYFTARSSCTISVPNHTVLTAAGGGLAGSVVGNTKISVNGNSGALRLYGGGIGLRPTAEELATLDQTAANGMQYGGVGGNATVDVDAGIIIKNVYGGGAGVESMVNGNSKIIDFPAMARVAGNTDVHISGTATTSMVFGMVFGGGDVANVGDASAEVPAPQQTSESNELASVRTKVTIDGGCVFQQVFAGGSGRPKAECSRTDDKDGYKSLGAVYGNSQLIIDAADPNNIPWLWNRLYGGGQNGTVYGNTDVQIKNGNLGYNIFGGGWGNLTTVHNPETGVEEQSLTFADVTQNTNVRITGGEFCLSQMWNIQDHHWEKLQKEYGSTLEFSPQFNPTTNTYLINHNIYGGGNVACEVGNNTYVTMTKGLIAAESSLGRQNVTNLFDEPEWQNVHKKHTAPHFSVFGGGFGPDTNVSGDTHVDIAIRDFQGSVNPSAFADPTTFNLAAAYPSRQSLLDVVGGGYSGKVQNTCHVNIDGKTFLRNVFGGAYFAVVGATDVTVKQGNIENIFGGGMMGDVLRQVDLHIGQEYEPGAGDAATKKEANAQVYILENIYGANDVAGYVGALERPDGSFDVTKGANGVDMKLYGGTICGNVYGGGNGNYLYHLDPNVEEVTAEEYYPIGTLPKLVFNTPVRYSYFPSLENMTPEQKIVNISSYRPAVSRVNVDFKGNSEDDRLRVKGSIFGGGCSATVTRYAVDSDDNPNHGVWMNVGSHVLAGNVFLGSDGADLFKVVVAEDIDFMNQFQSLNGLKLESIIDWDLPENRDIPYQFLPFTLQERKDIYNNLIDLYFAPVELTFMPELTWGKDRLNNSVWVARGTDDEGNACQYDDEVETPKKFTDTEVGMFCCGGNHGNMNTNTNFHINFPKGLTITDAIVGGCNDANYDFEVAHEEMIEGVLKVVKDTIVHEGGYLLGSHGVGTNHMPQIHLSIRNQFKMTDHVKGDMYPERCNVFGGCNESGTVRGDILIDMHSNMLMCDYDGTQYLGLDSLDLRTTTARDDNKNLTVASIYGGGKGTRTWVYGDTEVQVGDALSDHHSNYSPGAERYNVVGTSCNYVFGGGRKGNVVGNTNVRIYNGRVAGCVVGASYEGTLYGNAQTMVGYPEKFYRVNKTGVYDLERVDMDPDHLTYVDSLGNKVIKQQVWYTKGDLVPLSVVREWKGLRGNLYASVDEYNRAHGTAMSADKFNSLEEADKSKDFWVEHAVPDDNNWNNVTIQIDRAIYGGGYALSTNGSYTVRRYGTKKQYGAEKDCHFFEHDIRDVYGLTGDNIIEQFTKYGGNTFVMVGDISGDYESQASDGDPLAPLSTYNTPEPYKPVTIVTEGSRNRDHITLSSSALKPLNVRTGDDLFGYFYEMTNMERYPETYKEGDPHANDGSHTYMKVTYDKVKLSSDHHNYFEFVGEGGVYGDGHLSKSEGFRTFEAIGYGYNGSTPINPKLMNCVHRFDVARFKDCCISLLGDRDYATSITSTQAYSMAHVAEILMESSIDQTRDYLPDTQKFSRNYIGLSNSQFQLSAIRSNVQFQPKQIWDKNNSKYIDNPDYDETASLYHDSDNRVIRTGLGIEGTEDLQGVRQKSFTDAEKTFYQVKQWYLNEYKIGSDNSNYYDDVKAQVKQEKQFQLRNSATSKNMFGIFSGYALTVQGEHYADVKDEITQITKNTRLDYWGPVKGVFEIDLIGTRSGEAGGYAYAQNIHHNSVNSEDGTSIIEDPDVNRENAAHLPTFLETSGNFVFPATDSRKVIDNCFDTPFSLALRDAAPGHYWYVTGFKYFFNAYITGYTYDNKVKNFDMENNSHLIFMPGAKAGQDVTIQSFRFINRHSSDEKHEACDIENNYMTGYYANDNTDGTPGSWVNPVPTPGQLVHVCGHNKDAADHSHDEAKADTIAFWNYKVNHDELYYHPQTDPYYNLSLSISDKDTYSTTSYRRDKENTMYVDEEGNQTNTPQQVYVPSFETLLQDNYFMRPEIDADGTIIPNSYIREYVDQNQVLTSPMTINEPLISIRLKDAVNNNGKLEDGSSYFENYLSEPCTAILVLTTPAVNSLGQKIYNSYDAIPIKGTQGVTDLDFVNNTYGDLCYIDFNGDYVQITDTEAASQYDAGVMLFRPSQAKYESVGDATYVYGRKYYTLNDENKKGSNDPNDYTEANVTAVNYKDLKSTLYYLREGAKEALYEYHITLNIQYVKGPSYDGWIDIKNCALPGEMISLSRKNLHVESDLMTMGENGAFWTFGPGKKVIDDPVTGKYHWELVDPTGTKDKEIELPDGTTVTKQFYNEETRNLYYPYNPNVDPSDTEHFGKTYGIMNGAFILDRSNDQVNNADYYIPAYYFMNGYVAQFSFTVANLDEVFNTTINPMDTLLVHNYHHVAQANAEAAETATMDLKKYDIKLRKAVTEMENVPIARVADMAITDDMTDEQKAELQAFNDEQARLQEEFAQQWAGQHKRPKVYIQNLDDFNKFVQYVNRNEASLNETAYPLTNYGENTDFYLLANITLPAGWTPVKNFRGRFHGNGHVISGLNAADGYLFEALSNEEGEGEVFNLGLKSGRITKGDAHADNAKYHCCYTFDTAEKGGLAPNQYDIHTVYRMNGDAVTDYSEDDWRTGRVAYDLNEYYLAERMDRAVLDANEHEEAFESDTEVYRAAKDTHNHNGYVEEMYQDGEYRFAYYNSSAGNNEYLRKSATPSYNYGTSNTYVANISELTTFHFYTRDKENRILQHAIDSARVVYNNDAQAATYFGAGDLEAYNEAHKISKKDYRLLSEAQKLGYTGYDDYVEKHKMSAGDYATLVAQAETDPLKKAKLLRTPEVYRTVNEYRPLIDEKMFNSPTTAPYVKAVPQRLRNDYVFFGQTVDENSYGVLGSLGSNIPTIINAATPGQNGLATAYVTHNVESQDNRIWRAYGFYHSKMDDAYHFNTKAYVLHPGLTAIDFTGLHEPNHAWTVGLAEATTNSNPIFYPRVMDMPVGDNGPIPLTSFDIRDLITKNLVVYTEPMDATPVITAGVVNNRLSYDEATVEHNILGHHAIETSAGSGSYATPLFHLVERTASETGYSNDFNAPIEFNVTQRAWYQRTPQLFRTVDYVGSTESTTYGNPSAWDGICLPFTATKVSAAVNGEISHFYGALSKVKGADPATNDRTLHHEYWLTGMVGAVGENATFARPSATDVTSDYEDESLFSTPGTKYNGAADEHASATYTYNNGFFPALDGHNSNPVGCYDEVNNPWYTTSHDYADYTYLTRSVPYVISFPGKDFYEFDLSGQWYKDVYNPNHTHQYPETSQTITYEAHTATIRVSDDETKTTTIGSHSHMGTYMAYGSSGDIMGALDGYGMKNDGTEFNSGVTSVVPFRTYMNVASSARPHRVIINDTSNSIVEVDKPIEPDNEDGNSGVGPKFTMRLKGLKVIVTSTYDTLMPLSVYNSNGVLIRVVDVPTGETTFQLPQPGVYIIGKRKVAAGR